MTVLILIVVGYLLFHAGHTHQRYRQTKGRHFLARVWISVPGPWGTRISKRL
jgi:hypothetical protein